MANLKLAFLTLVVVAACEADRPDPDASPQEKPAKVAATPETAAIAIPCGDLFARTNPGSGGSGDAVSAEESPVLPEEMPSLDFDFSERVSGGRKASKGEAIGIVQVTTTYTNSDNSRVAVNCTGSLIAPDWVLTAAHCGFRHDKTSGVEIAGSNRTTIRYGSLAKDGGTAVSGAFLCHADYGMQKGNFKNDLALIKLDRPVTTEKPLPLVSLSDPKLVGKAGVAFTTYGFGFTGHKMVDGKPEYFGTEVLKAGRMTTSSIVKGSTIFSAPTSDPDDNPTGVCKGDSGGPVIVEASATAPRRVVGVNSMIWPSKGAYCGNRNILSSFVDLRQFTGWIATMTNGADG